ncbi:MAG: hypothetical protein IKE28_01415 [Solobacterium sp.]|nr:hypothetical protein [Solobacterium sp.]
MKIAKTLITAALTASLCTVTYAEGGPDDAGLQFDFNRDGITDETDWKLLKEFAQNYKMSEGEETHFASQEFPATFNLLVDQYYGSRADYLYSTDLSGVSEYYLPSLGDSTVVKNQSPFGSCWAFAGISSVESNLLRKRHSNPDDPSAYQLDFSKQSSEIDLSELYLAYENLDPVAGGPQKSEGLLSLSDDINSHFSVGGFGGSIQSITAAWNGPVTEAQEPYEPLSGEEDGAAVYGLKNEAEDHSAPAAAHIQKYIYLDSPSVFHVDLDQKHYSYDAYDEQAVLRAKQALYQYGALMLSYGADMSMPGDNGISDYFNYVNWSQYDNSDSISMNHMVSIVGWNDNYPKENFGNDENSQPETDGAWLIKNSWGNFDLYYEKYGQTLVDALDSAKGTEDEILYNRYYSYGIPDENGHGSGYFWLSYCDHSITTISALEADDGLDGFDYDNLYQYDFSIQMSFLPTSIPAGNTETKTANIFTVANEETLSAVSVMTPQNQCTAEIEIYEVPEDFEKDPTAGKLLYSDTVSLDERGFHTIPLKQMVPLEKGSRFAVIEKIISPAGYSWLNLETILKPELQTPDNINEVTCTVVSNPGETLAYVSDGDSMVWKTPEELNQTSAGEVFEFGNAYIKAYTVNGHPAVTENTPEPVRPEIQTVGGSGIDFIVMAAAALIAAAAAYFVSRSDSERSGK